MSGAYRSDFTQTEIIEDFYNSLESSLEGKSGEGAIYMGESWDNRRSESRSQQVRA